MTKGLRPLATDPWIESGCRSISLPRFFLPYPHGNSETSLKRIIEAYDT
jgi:hypothetical protein